jgi:hypothetical protein
MEITFRYDPGVAVSFAMMWSRQKRLSGKVVKSDGPTMSEHRVSVAEDGIRSSSRHIEPGAGALVPRNAFANPAAEAAFLEAVRGQMASAKATA